MSWKIGVMVESFRLGIKDGIRKAAEVGADGIQVYVTSGETTPDALAGAKRDEFAKFIADQGLVISALCADFGKGFLDASANDELVAKSKQCVDLALDLGVEVLTTHIGRLPHDAADPKYQACLRAIGELAVYAESKGRFFATETGPENAEDLLAFLERVGSAGIKVNYDPANLVMCGFDHLGGVDVLGDYIVHTHAKDGKADGAMEVALGQGDVNFPAYLKRLEAAGYEGFLTIEREVGDDPVSDIVQAVSFLRSM